MSEGAAVAEFSDVTKELGDKIVALTLLEAKSLADYLEQVHGIKPAGGAVIAAGLGGIVQHQEDQITGAGDAILIAIPSSVHVAIGHAVHTIRNPPEQTRGLIPQSVIIRIQTIGWIRLRHRPLKPTLRRHQKHQLLPLSLPQPMKKLL